MLYEQIEPFGDRRGDLQAGIITSTIANVNRGQNQPSYSVSDFMPKWETFQERRQTAEDQLKFMLLIQEAQNARVANG